MAGQERTIPNDDVVTDGGVVTDMTVGHEEVVRTEAGGIVRIVRAMNGDVLANNVVVTNHDGGRTATKAEILRKIADDGAGVDAVARAEGGCAGEINMGTDLAFVADADFPIDHGVGTNADPGTDASTGMNDSGRMNHTKIRERKGEMRVKSKL